MSETFDRLKGRRSRLPDPPPDTTDNLRAPETAPAGAQLSQSPDSTVAGITSPRPRIDGRSRLRKDRTETLSTKIKPQHRELLVSLADAFDLTLSETLEKAIDTLAAAARREGKTI